MKDVGIKFLKFKTGYIFSFLFSYSEKATTNLDIHHNSLAHIYLIKPVLKCGFFSGGRVDPEPWRGPGSVPDGVQ